MSTVILTCSSLKDYVKAAMESQNVYYDVIMIDQALHVEPEVMKEAIAGEIGKLSYEVDTILVAMGFCGGVWDHVTLPYRVVIPRVDDCISLLLQIDDTYCPNRKEFGHLYIYEQNPDDFSAIKLMKDAPDFGKEYAGISDEMLFQMFFGQYRNMDIIDTGLNDCYSEEYVIAAQENADQIGAVLDYVQGSNRMLEKLLTGKWDEQFLVAEPGHLIRHGDFF